MAIEVIVVSRMTADSAAAAMTASTA